MKMRASWVRNKHKIAIEQVDVLPPQKDEVLVRSAWAAICGSDVHVVHADLPLPPRMANPGTPGHEGIGYVEESMAEGYRKGDLVVTIPGYEARTGTFCDYQTSLARYHLKVPKTDLPLEQIMMAQQFGTTIYSMRQVPIDVVGKTVMVMGQGSAGLFFAWSMKRAGAAKVIASDKMPARLAVSKHFGVDVAVEAGDKTLQAVMDHTGGVGADYLIEAVGSAEATLQSIALIREGGHGLYFGLPDTNKPILFNFHDFQRKRLTINSTTHALRDHSMISFQRALDLIVNREIDVAPIVSHRYGIEQIEEAMEVATTYRDEARKVCLKF
jgi:threonine dehydrogenase-like Zn-dependent dehydrogenase